MQYIDGLTKTFSDDTVEKFMTISVKEYIAKKMGGEFKNSKFVSKPGEFAD